MAAEIASLLDRLRFGEPETITGHNPARKICDTLKAPSALETNSTIILVPTWYNTGRGRGARLPSVRARLILPFGHSLGA
ncbi:hypothetical protein CS8_055120 [Cupriavidus sp. 8B]